MNLGTIADANQQAAIDLIWSDLLPDEDTLGF